MMAGEPCREKCEAGDTTTEAGHDEGLCPVHFLFIQPVTPGCRKVRVRVALPTPITHSRASPTNTPRDLISW